MADGPAFNASFCSTLEALAGDTARAGRLTTFGVKGIEDWLMVELTGGFTAN